MTIWNELPPEAWLLLAVGAVLVGLSQWPD